MKSKYFFVSLLIAVLFSCTDDRNVKNDAILIDPNSVLVYYWNFNSISGTVTDVAPDYSLSPATAKITYSGSGAGYIDAFSPGYSINARNNDIDGAGLRARNPSDTRSLEMDLPTVGFNKIVVQFATARSGSGATTQNYSYTTDGSNYVNTGLSVNSFNPDSDPAAALVTLDFSAIASVNNNPNFKLKIEFSGDTASGSSGNNRFDNVTVQGVAVPHVVDPNLYLFQYWNFNAVNGVLTSIAPDASLIAANTANITFAGTGAGYMDSFTPSTALNAQNSDAAGNGLRLRNPSDSRSLLIAAPTTGFKNVIVKFATAKSSAAGASIQNYSYSIDGTTFITANLPVVTFSPDIDPIYNIVTLDFTTITGANNNPDFILKINFGGPEATGAGGNNRIDNITFQGNQL